MNDLKTPERSAALFRCGDSTISQQDFIDALAAAGLKRGDVCFVHSDMGQFGLPQSLDRRQLLESMAAVFFESVGPAGTVVFPTFTYSYCNGEVFDVDRTATKMGALNEHFRKLPGVRRSAHPLFSVAAWGRHKDQITDVSDDSFDADSVFGRLHRLGGKLVFFGVPFQTCTFVHYIEQALGVPYRYLKTFTGTRIDAGKSSESQCTYYVRRLDANVVTDLGRLERELTARGLMRCVRLGGGGAIQVVEADDVFDTGADLLRQDVFALLREPPELKAVDAAS